MKKEIKLPELGEDVDEGDVLKVLVSSGDRVEKDQPILEIETDKATLEVPAEAAGTIAEVKVSKGDRIRVGQVLLVLETEAEGEEEAEEEADEREERVEDDKEEGEAIEEEEEPAEPAPPAEEDYPPEPRPRNVPAAPSVRRLARELGVDISQVEGSGRGGRISAHDVKEHAKAILSRSGGVSPASPALPDFGRWGATERERLSGLRRAAARNLARAWSQIPHVSHHDRADVTEVEKVREKYGGRVESLGGKLTLTALAIHIVASALRKFPRCNASIDVVREEIVFKKFIHIGVAVDTERGLVVPVLRNADRMSLAEIAVSLTALAEKARSGDLAREDMEGSSFTVTNLGGIGGTSFTPIVQWPEVAILGISRSRLEPVWSNGGFEPRRFLPLSLSYDHRLIDGADAARFLRFVVEAFEHPLLMSLEKGS